MLRPDHCHPAVLDSSLVGASPDLPRALVSGVLPPRVLDQPVVHAALRPPSDERHRVTPLFGSTLGYCVDALRVRGEVAVDLEGHHARPVHEELLHNLAHALLARPADVVRGALQAVELVAVGAGPAALLLLRLVRVAKVLHREPVLIGDALVDAERHSAVTAVVAVHHLLRRHDDVPLAFGVKAHSRRHGRRCREGVARPTRALPEDVEGTARDVVGAAVASVKRLRQLSDAVVCSLRGVRLPLGGGGRDVAEAKLILRHSLQLRLHCCLPGELLRVDVAHHRVRHRQRRGVALGARVGAAAHHPELAQQVLPVRLIARRLVHLVVLGQVHHTSGEDLFQGPQRDLQLVLPEPQCRLAPLVVNNLGILRVAGLERTLGLADQVDVVLQRLCSPLDVLVPSRQGVATIRFIYGGKRVVVRPVHLPCHVGEGPRTRERRRVVAVLLLQEIGEDICDALEAREITLFMAVWQRDEVREPLREALATSRVDLPPLSESHGGDAVLRASPDCRQAWQKHVAAALLERRIGLVVRC
mmetsp:Transcript_41366/g.82820  ORF Transcript_41366/g.82820 Transcript_41366/m.82820 type:complete len:531 (+) Transcript_41366:1547-3139(+)